MITRVVFICCVCLVLIAPTNSAGTKQSIDCKKVDQQKFKELFTFKYFGGQQGLALDFGFVGNSNKFKIEKCEFLLKDTKLSKSGAKNYIKPADKKKLNGLTACTKYDVNLMIQNIATKKDFGYQNSVVTKIDRNSAKIQLKVDKKESDSVRLLWNTLDASCISNYSVVVRNHENGTVFEETQPTGGFVIATNLTACEVYSAQVVVKTLRDEEVKSPEKQFSLQSDTTIEDLKLNIDEVNGESASLSWSTEPEVCLIEYKLNIRSGDKLVHEVHAFTSAAVINNLTSCSNYSAELIALDGDKRVLKAVTRSFVTHAVVDEVKVALVQGTSKVKVSWAPAKHLDCIANYTIKYTIEDCQFSSEDETHCNETVAVDKSSKWFVFNSLPLAERFLLEFYVNETSGDARLAKKVPFTTIDREKFLVNNINEFRREKTKLQLRWNLDGYFHKILKHFEVTFDGKVFETRDQLIDLDVAACGKNYTAQIRCLSTDNETIGPAVTHQTNLNDDDIPLSSLRNAIEHQQANNSVIISWSPLEEEKMCIAYYEVDFNDQSFKTNDTRTEINDFAPCIDYKLDITPISKHGKRGATATYEFTAKEFYPKKPSNLKLIEAGNRELKLSTRISKDDKHCRSTSIEFTCNDRTVTVTAELSTASYFATLTELSPFTKYNCLARVRNNAGVSESTDVEVFSTKQEGPQSPIDLEVVESYSNAAHVKWKADESAGTVEKFKLYVSFEAANYERIDGCDEKLQKKFVFDTKDTEVNITAIQAFTKYSVRVTAENDYGISDPSKKIFFNTKPSPASSPRDPSITFTPSSNNSVISGILRWKAPCQLNGLFSLYTITLKGHKFGFKDHVHTEASSFEQLKLNDLRRGYSYEVRIQTVASQLPGKHVKMSFRAPSGLPLREDLRKWTNVDDDRVFEIGNVDLFIRRGVFVSAVAEIKGLAFLVFLANCPTDNPEPTQGFLVDGVSQLLSTQEAKNKMSCSELYQHTDILPNPINFTLNESLENLDNYNIKFTIGGEICSNKVSSSRFCNDHLEPSTRYGVIARVFTENGFTDTEPVFISIKTPPMKLISPATIALSTIVLVTVLSLLILVFCIFSSRRKKKRTKKVIEAAEADENLLSFTSYCVIDKHPLPRKHYDD